VTSGRPCAAVVVAAGSGERLGAGPKAFVELAGEPLLRHAARHLLASGVVDVLVVVAGPAELERARATVADLVPAAAALTVCAGGATRAESVGRGLASVPPQVEVVAVHDGARALVSPGLVARTVTALEPPWDAVAPALPVVDTLKLVDGERVLRTVDRRALYGVQTPQVFERRTLEQLHARLDAATATDDLLLVEQAGGRVRLVEGERRNLKITYPEDLALAEALLAAEPA
jgi:2-C-methyl-D-erythritol 4-phosphate cytidylyltransferase